MTDWVLPTKVPGRTQVGIVGAGPAGLVFSHLLYVKGIDSVVVYFQCDPADAVTNWPDDRIWSELDARLATNDGWDLYRGAIFQKGIIQMRSFVVEPMQFGSMFLAGDAAHIVPPTGAKGLNLAVADVNVLAEALADYYAEGSREAVARYSPRALERVWAAEHFSWWMTSMLHRFEDGDAMHRRLQTAQLNHVVNSRALQTVLAESYVGLPLPGRTAASDLSPRSARRLTLHPYS